MRILVLNYEYPPLGGGAGPVCQQLCEEFARRDHAVEVVTMGFRGLERQVEMGSVRVTRVPAIRKHQATCETPEMLSYVISAWPRVAWRLATRRYDVIHCHFVVPTGLLAWLCSWTSRVPYIVTSHGSDIPGFNPDRFTREHKRMRPLLLAVIGRSAALTSPSVYLKSLIQDQLGISAIHHIPNGVDTEYYRPKTKQRRILMTGRLLPRKGFQYVLEALEGVDSDFEVHIAGDGPFRAELEQRAKRLSCSVVFHGWLDQGCDTLRELYEESMIYCLPSARENASVALLEAMSAGMAVVSSNTTGCAETVADAGILVEPESVEPIRRALAELRSVERCAELGARARRRAIEHFSWPRIADAYLNLMQDASTGRRIIDAR